MNVFKSCCVLLALLCFAGCENPEGPRGEPGVNAGEGPFTFTLDGTPPQEIRGLAAFSAALQTALEAQPAGDTAANPAGLKVEGLNLGRKEELTALYGALTRYVDLDLSACGGITLATVAPTVFRENRDRIVSLTLPEGITE
jgi:hypothetical protein